MLRDEWGIELKPGLDEASLAMIADAWSRTYRSTAITLAPTKAAVTTANGVRILPDHAVGEWPNENRVSIHAGRAPVAALDEALHAIAVRYGEPTANVVAMQLEYPR